MDDILRSDGELEVERTAPDEFTARIELPLDADGLLARRCPGDDCSPAYFKVKPGTGIQGVEDPQLACPYCMHSTGFQDFATEEQVEYAQALLKRGLHEGVGRVVDKALDLGPSGNLGGGMISLEVSREKSPRASVTPPEEERLRRDVTCPDCGLTHAVFGLATWCPDCGSDIFLGHLDAELQTLSQVLAQVAVRAEELGPRIAARDLENVLEDLVSVFEAVLKFIARRHLLGQNMSEEDVDAIIGGQIRNGFQNVRRAEQLFSVHVGGYLFDGCDPEDIELLANTFEKRHPVTHNLGVLDRKYLRNARTGELPGREVSVTKDELTYVLGLVLRVLSSAYQRLYPASTQATRLDTRQERPAKKPTPGHNTGLSDPAFAVASLLARDSQHGHPFHPSYGMEELAEKTALSTTLLEEAVDELIERGYVTEGRWKTSHPQACPAHKLYCKLDPILMGWNPKEDAVVVARLLVEELKTMSPEDLDARLGWGVRRLNPACVYLDEMGWADTRKVCGSSHYEVSYLQASPTTRRIVRQS